MFGFGKKAGPTIGLDINSSTLSVLQLEKTKTDLKVSRFASMLTPPDIVREGLLTDPEAVGTAVRELLESAGFGGKGPVPVANIGIPGQSVVIRLMPVPKGMPNEELNDVVKQEAVNNLPFPIEEANIDWIRVPGTSRMDPDGVEREDVLLGAIQKIIVDAYWRMADIANVQLGKLEISSLAAVRALAFSGQLGREGALSLVVNIRQDATDITLVNKSVPLFSRSVLLGVETIIESMQRSINASTDEARQMLSKIQLLGVPTVEPRLGQAAQVTRSVCGDLTSEVGRSLEFYMSQVGMVRVDQVLVCGAGTVIPEIDQFIANRLNLNAAVANPFQGIIYDRNQIVDNMRPHHTMLMGLVLDNASGAAKTVSIDLNQGEPTLGEDEDTGEEGEVEEIDTPWFYPALIAGGVIMLLVVGAWAYFQYMVIPGKEQKIASLEQEIGDNKKKLETMVRQQDDVQELQARKAALDSVVNHGTPMSIVMQSLKENVPQGVNVTSLTTKGDSVTILGNTADFTKAADLAINLQGSNTYSNVGINYIKRIYAKPSFIAYQLDTVLSPDLNRRSLEPEKISGSADLNSMSTGPKVLHFTSLTMVPCQRVRPIFDQAQQKYSAQMQFQTIDADDPGNASLLKKYDVSLSQLPVTVFLDSTGQVKDRVQGFDGKSDQLFAACDKLGKLAASPSSAK